MNTEQESELLGAFANLVSTIGVGWNCEAERRGEEGNGEQDGSGIPHFVWNYITLYIYDSRFVERIYYWSRSIDSNGKAKQQQKPSQQKQSILQGSIF